MYLQVYKTHPRLHAIASLKCEAEHHALMRWPPIKWEWKSGRDADATDGADAVRPRHETQSDHLAPTPNLLRGKGKGRSVTLDESDVSILNLGNLSYLKYLHLTLLVDPQNSLA